MSLKEISDTIQTHFRGLFTELDSSVHAREDSRAFGAMIEARIGQAWENMCSQNSWKAQERPGKRTIYDFSFIRHNTLHGIDIKTKDLDSKKYSDGGICAVSNLLRFLANDKAHFLIAEFGHTQATHKDDFRSLDYIYVVPFIYLPIDAYRIENLGTGQVRLNYSIAEIYDEIEWGRDLNIFYDSFIAIALRHYARVGSDAQRRMDSLKKFKENGYVDFKFK